MRCVPGTLLASVVMPLALPSRTPVLALPLVLPLEMGLPAEPACCSAVVHPLGHCCCCRLYEQAQDLLLPLLWRAPRALAAACAAAPAPLALPPA